MRGGGQSFGDALFPHSLCGYLMLVQDPGHVVGEEDRVHKEGEQEGLVEQHKLQLENGFGAVSTMEYFY